jgi:hypothetical protein
VQVPAVNDIPTAVNDILKEQNLQIVNDFANVGMRIETHKFVVVGGRYA